MTSYFPEFASSELSCNALSPKKTGFPSTTETLYVSECDSVARALTGLALEAAFVGNVNPAKLQCLFGQLAVFGEPAACGRAISNFFDPIVEEVMAQSGNVQFQTRTFTGTTTSATATTVSATSTTTPFRCIASRFEGPYTDSIGSSKHLTASFHTTIPTVDKCADLCVSVAGCKAFSFQSQEDALRFALTTTTTTTLPCFHDVFDGPVSNARGKKKYLVQNFKKGFTLDDCASFCKSLPDACLSFSYDSTSACKFYSTAIDGDSTDLLEDPGSTLYFRYTCF